MHDLQLPYCHMGTLTNAHFHPHYPYPKGAHMVVAIDLTALYVSPPSPWMIPSVCSTWKGPATLDKAASGSSPIEAG